MSSDRLSYLIIMCAVSSSKPLAAFCLQGIDLKASFAAPYDKIRFTGSYDRARRTFNITLIRHDIRIVYLELLTATDGARTRPRAQSTDSVVDIFCLIGPLEMSFFGSDRRTKGSFGLILRNRCDPACYIVI